MACESDFTLNYGVRYDYYAPLRERDNRIVKFNIDNGHSIRTRHRSTSR
jgi:hypothetical protein